MEKNFERTRHGANTRRGTPPGEGAGMKVLVFDVMLDGRFVRTLRYKYCPLFPIGEKEIRDFVLGKLPTLAGKPFNVAF